jgi:hypothetical protein
MNYYNFNFQVLLFLNEEIKLAQTCLVPNESLYESIAKLSEKIFTEFEFNSGATTINTPLSEV